MHARRYYLGEDGEQQGPIEGEHLAELCADGWLALDTPVYSAWLGEWTTLEQVGSLPPQHRPPPGALPSSSPRVCVRESCCMLEQVGSLRWLAVQMTPSDESAVWFVLDARGSSRGPLTCVQLKALMEEGEVTGESAVWSKVVGEWARICDTAALRGLVAV